MNRVIDEDEIDLKEIIKTVGENKPLIIFSASLFFFLALIYAYFATNIYKTTTLIKLASEQKQQQQGDEFMSEALGKEAANIDDEITVFKTRYMVQKALHSLDIRTRYFTTEKLKTREFYKNAPFVVTAERLIEGMHDVQFKLITEDADRFRLVTDHSLKEKILDTFSMLPDELIEYDQIHKFGSPIVTPWFSLTVEKVFELDNGEYTFSVMSDDAMIEFVGDRLSASAETKLGKIVALSFEDNSPLRAKEFLDALSRAYVQENLDIKSAMAKKKLDFIDMQLNAINKTLKGSEKNLEEYKATNIVVDLSSKAQLTSEKLSELESQLYEQNLKKGVLENVLNYIEQNKALKNISVSASRLESPALDQLIEELQKANTELASLLTDFTPLHPDVVKVNQRIDSLRGALKDTLQSNLRNVLNRSSELNRIIQSHQKSLQALPEQERQLTRLTRNFQVNEKIYSFLLQKRAEAAIVESSNVLETRVVEPATLPKKPIKPKRILILLVSIVAGLIIGIALAFLRDYLDDTVKGIEDIENRTTIPVYGVVPFFDEKSSMAAYYESMRVISTNVEFLQTKTRSKLVTVTSTVAGEGKSSTLSELAKVLASNERRVIILDLDLRRSSLHEKLSLKNEKGMSTLLSGRHTVSEVTQKSKTKNMDVITAGPVPPNPMGLIMSDKLQVVVDELMGKYDYVLLDAPPIGLVADAMAIMRMADITLIVLRAEYSKKEFVNGFGRFTKDSNINPGVVLNGVQKRGHYGYGYGSNYGSSYGSDYYTKA